MYLLDIHDLSAAEIRAIWALVQKPRVKLAGRVAWSFEGDGVRTRTGFVQAFEQLGLAAVELPNVLKTTERARDLAGYLDSFYSAYVVRESNHERLREFAEASSRPVINAMSSQAHPCEVLADAYFIDSEIGSIEQVRIGLWGPPTNVLQSWHQLAGVLGIEILHFCGTEFHVRKPGVRFLRSASEAVDILVTDGWPSGFSDAVWTLTSEHLAQLGQPELLPTPPFSLGRELAVDPVSYEGFVGYAQKHVLLDVQRALLTHLLTVVR